MVEQKGRHKFIDRIHVTYKEREKAYWAEMENFGSNRIQINPKFYQDNEKLLEGGVWAEVTVGYNENDEDDYAFYIEDLKLWQHGCNQTESAGFKKVASYNPYWDSRGLTYEDVDGYRVVFQNENWTV